MLKLQYEMEQSMRKILFHSYLRKEVLPNTAKNIASNEGTLRDVPVILVSQTRNPMSQQNSDCTFKIEYTTKFFPDFPPESNRCAESANGPLSQ